MNPTQIAYDIFQNVVGSSPDQILAFATTNENLEAIKLFTTQYLAQVRTTLGLPA